MPWLPTVTLRAWSHQFLSISPKFHHVTSRNHDLSPCSHHLTSWQLSTQSPLSGFLVVTFGPRSVTNVQSELQISFLKKCIYSKHRAQGIMNMIKSGHITQKKEEAIACCRWSQLVVLQFSPMENNSMIACEKASWWESSFNLLHLFILYPTCVGIEWLVGVGSLSMCGHPGSISGHWSNSHFLENLFFWDCRWFWG